jgi:hypothetical protein
LWTDSVLRRICGWERKNDVPKEWFFCGPLLSSRNPIYQSGLQALAEVAYQGGEVNIFLVVLMHQAFKQ